MPIIDQVLCGDVRQEISKLPEAHVDCVVTSPPYFRQRDYRHPLQIGGEESPDSYLAALQNVARGLLRVVKPSGSLWLILGDKYHDGQLLGLPWRAALAFQQAGWLLRADVIWHKPNAMPSPTRNRPTIDHEYVFFFARSPKYYYDADAIREPHVTFTPQSRMRGGRSHFGKRGGTPEQGKNGGHSNLHDGRWDQAFHPRGRNKRTVWSIPLSKFRDAHFAVFPDSLVETCIQASCPEGGLVLDPFGGSGTTGAVAKRLGRRYLLIDCVPEYCEMARQRIKAALSKSANRQDKSVASG